LLQLVGDFMHEMVEEESTEQKLKEICTQVGEHLFLKKGIQLDTPDIDNDSKSDLQIVFSMGGAGTRLKHITGDKYSKHLIEVAGKPISRYVVDAWLQNGFSNFCMLVDDTHRGQSVQNEYKDGKDDGCAINYSVEHKMLGSGGAIKLAIDNGIITKSFINHYPDDIIINYPNFAHDFARVFTAAMASGYQCVILCTPGKRYQWGVVIDDGTGKVTDFVEKPFVEMDSNVGIYGMSAEAFPMIQQIEEDKAVKMERSVLKQIAQNGKMLKVLLPSEYWVPVNDEPNLNKFVEIIRQKH